MRVLIFLWLVGTVAALADAVIWEGEGWYKGASKRLGKRRSTNDASAKAFANELEARGLPTSTISVAEFFVGIGTTNGHFRRFGLEDGGSEVKKKFLTLNYKMTDLLDEMRLRRAIKETNSFKFAASKIIDHSNFPEADFKNGELFDMAKMQRLMSARAEQLRTMAKEGSPQASLIESWVKDRANALEVENMYRNADQARYKSEWVDEELKYGPSNSYKQIKTPRLVIFPDGTRPEKDLRPNRPPNTPDLEIWEEVDMDRTLAQGGQSSIAKDKRKAATKKAGTYGKWQGDPDSQKKKATSHMEIIRANSEMIPFHRNKKGEFLKCHSKPGRRSALLRGRGSRISKAYL
ncbi:hypothetical protein MHUMG1_09292 [Metarhizium humberi]|uniref:Uncharacterized protein n=1 Tax=Metarhizium humberi TaxID=2596975 RepID=A0A9P8M3G6_9HYPO|nr:hypothetical protein MHUMG1_09292 [Metarhizium humberi]